MSEQDNGGPAFPAYQRMLQSTEQGALVPVGGDGMSLRDWFAGQTLMSLPHLCAADTLMDGVTFERHVARNAYRMADAMLAERAKGGAA